MKYLIEDMICYVGVNMLMSLDFLQNKEMSYSRYVLMLHR